VENEADYRAVLTYIRKIVRSINLESKRILKDFGISIPQLLCLTYLSKKEHFQASHKELTEHLHLNSSTVTGIVNRLEKNGLIARLPKRDDRRVTHISLTTAGYKLLQSTPDLLQERMITNLDKLSPTTIKEIKSSLEILVNVLGIKGLDASPLLIVDDPSQQEQ
jgi:DNA-binding MarR family transcriptional regulator